jgi:isoleucyl-tRNA synthetase
VDVTVDGEIFAIQPDEVEVRMQAKEGLVVATEGAYLAALDTVLTPELEQEGLVREMLRRVQDLRKTADLAISDRIDVVYQASGKLSAAMKAHADKIMSEVLAVSLTESDVPEDWAQVSENFGGEEITVGLKKA